MYTYEHQHPDIYTYIYVSGRWRRNLANKIIASNLPLSEAINKFTISPKIRQLLQVISKNFLEMKFKRRNELFYYIFSFFYDYLIACYFIFVFCFYELSITILPLLTSEVYILYSFLFIYFSYFFSS